MASKYMNTITVFYDADCGFCQASIDWLSKDLVCNIQKIPYQNQQRIKGYELVDLSIANEKMQALYNNKIYSGAKAAGICLILKKCYLYKLIGYMTLILSIFKISDLFYFIIAKNRKKISKILNLTSCKI